MTWGLFKRGLMYFKILGYTGAYLSTRAVGLNEDLRYVYKTFFVTIK